MPPVAKNSLTEHYVPLLRGLVVCRACVYYMPLQGVWEIVIFNLPNVHAQSSSVRIFVSNVPAMCIVSGFERGFCESFVSLSLVL